MTVEKQVCSLVAAASHFATINGKPVQRQKVTLGGDRTQRIAEKQIQGPEHTVPRVHLLCGIFQLCEPVNCLYC